MRKRLFTSLVLLTVFLGTSNSFASDFQYEIPKLVSLDFTPKEIDLSQPNQNVKITLKVSHPNGIDRKSTRLNSSHT